MFKNRLSSPKFPLSPRSFLEAGYSHGFWSWLSKNKCTGGPFQSFVKIDPSSTVFPLLTSYRIYQLAILRGSLHWKEPIQISNAANQQCQLLNNINIQKHSFDNKYLPSIQMFLEITFSYSQLQNHTVFQWQMLHSCPVLL